MDSQANIRFRFLILLGVTFIAGLSQGMLMPVTAILFEKAGMSSALNGFHATGVYIGILIATPFMEGLLRKIGYKSLLILGGVLIVVPLALFPVWDSYTFWFILRLFIGVAISMLQFGAQTWITSFTPMHKRGRNISIFGLAFGLGFGVGPLLTNFLEIHESLPFYISSAIGLVSLITLFYLKNEFPEKVNEKPSLLNSFKRFGQAWKYAWVAFLLPFSYGFLEASLNGNFPVYALNIGIEVKAVAIILPAFAIGSTVFQLPLGMLSDYFERKKVLVSAMFMGAIAFAVAGFVQESATGLIICFFIAGMMVGSTYSLGVSYMVDLVPKNLLPTGNILCSLLFSIGSIGGPFIGGLALEYLNGVNFFYIISFVLIMIFTSLLFFKKDKQDTSKVSSVS